MYWGRQGGIGDSGEVLEEAGRYRGQNEGMGAAGRYRSQRGGIEGRMKV